MIRVLLADDHPIFREGLRSALHAVSDVRIVAEAEDGVAAVDAIRRHQPDVAVLDLQMPGLSGIEVASQVLAETPDARLVLLTAHDDEALVRKALDTGLRGYILKDAAVREILGCVRQVHAGQHYVSPRLSSFLVRRRGQANALDARPGMAALTATERRVLTHVAKGMTSREIGAALFVSPRTVENHRASIAQKLDLRGPNALIAFAVAHRSELE